MSEIELCIRLHHSKAQAALIRRLGNLSLAQDAMQDAIVAALEKWPEQGIPQHPATWLVTVGLNRFRDDFRRQARFTAADESHQEQQGVADPAMIEASLVENDVLRLMFLCAHPALSAENQLAMSLKFVAGLNTIVIAQAMLVSVKTIEQRITRSKQKIANSGIGFDFPLPTLLDARLPPVQSSLYLLFNAGYFGAEGELLDPLLCRQAISLARALCRVYPDPENFGLLALMLFHNARWKARADTKGRLVTLDNQDRTLWSKQSIAEADVMLQKSLRAGPPGQYQLQAAIAGVHCLADSASETNWKEIAGLYRLLLNIQNGPVIRLNYSVALMMLGQLTTAESLLAEMAPDLPHYAPYFAALSKLMELQGRPEERRRALCKAVDFSTSSQERSHYQFLLEA